MGRNADLLGDLRDLFMSGFKLNGSNAKPQATITRPSDTNSYTVGDVVGQNPAANLTFSNVVSTTGGQFIITSVTLEIDVAAIPSGMAGFRLHLYDATPTAIADNSAYDLAAGDRNKYLGNIILGAPVDLGSTLWGQNDGLNFSGKLAAGSTSIYGILETLGAFTPTAQTVKVITLYTVGV